MNRKRTRARSVWAAAALALVSTLGTSTMAMADDVLNDLPTPIDATAKSMALNVGGADGTATFFVSPTGGDGKSGCNLTGSTTFSVAVSSSNAAVATASLSDKSGDGTGSTFTSCGDEKVVTVTPVSSGTTTISLSQTANTSGGSFNLAPATFTVTVAASNSAPEVTVNGVSQGASYDKGSVPAATCEVPDTEDGPVPSFPATLSGSLDADGLGSQTASCSYTDGGPGPLTESVSATYYIVDRSAPVIGYTLSPAGPDGLDGWYRSSVTLTWNVSEPQSHNSLQTTGCVDQTITADQDATTYSCSATSSGGSTGPVQVSVKRDGNGPVVSYDQTATAAPNGDNGWYVSPVTATFRATDAFSGMAAGTDARTVTSTGDGAAVSLDSPAFSDRAGNTTPAGAVHSPAFKIDTVAPSVGEGAVTSGEAGKNGWYTSPVTASFTATDGTSGVAGDKTRTASTGTDQGEVTLLSPAFSDVAGNTTAAGAKKVTVKVDSEVPSVDLVGGPDQGASYTFGSVPAAPTCGGSDATSGLDTCVVSGYGTGVGTHTVTATATDLAGNTTTVSRTYAVLAWGLKGFYQPVDMGGVINKVKGGSTVPLKFEVFAGSTELTDVSAVKSFGAATINCSTTAVTDTIELVTTGGTSLRYDTTGGQFVQNWKTPTAQGCYEVTMTTQDGSKLTAKFQVTK